MTIRISTFPLKSLIKILTYSEDGFLYAAYEINLLHCNHLSDLARAFRGIASDIEEKKVVGFHIETVKE